jgi:hypothetical protein
LGTIFYAGFLSMIETLSRESSEQPVERNAGRKPSNQSRAAEFREKLAAWRRMPEFSRPPLRAVARELGTSHQLLSHYLKTWDRWQEKEYRRNAAEIRARAESENRPLTQWEQSQADAYQRKAFQVMLTSMLDSELNKMLARLKAGGMLSKGEIRFINLGARKGFPIAQKIARSYSENSVKKSKNNLPRRTLASLSPLDEREAGWQLL